MLHRTAFIPELQRLSRVTGGVPTGPVFGFLRVLRANLNTFKADACIVVWDSAGGSAHRREIYPEYKANRKDKEKPEALEHINEQREVIQSILPYLNIKQLAISGFEGDDLIHLLLRTVARTAVIENKSDRDIIVVTGDKDLLQLVHDGVSVYRPIADQLIEEDNFEEMTGVPNYKMFVLRKAVMGDTSDNIAGIRGIGEKTATKLLKETYCVEGTDTWVSDADPGRLKLLCSEHKTKTAKRIAEQWDVVERNIKLVDLSKIRFSRADYKKADAVLKSQPGDLSTDIELMQMLGKYEFNEFTGRFMQWVQPFRGLR